APLAIAPPSDASPSRGPGRHRAEAKPCAPRRGHASWPSRAGGCRGTPPAWSRPLEVLPALAERAGRHGRQVSRTRPLTAEEREAAAPAMADEGPRGQPGEPRPEAEDGRRGHGPSSEAEDHALAPRRDLLAVHVLAELHEHARDVDAHGADVLAGAAEGRG